jgi:beta-glucosidase
MARGRAVSHIHTTLKEGGMFDVAYSPAYQILPLLDSELVTETGHAGWTLTWHNMSEDGDTILSESLSTQLVDETSMFLVDAIPPPGAHETWGLRLRGKLRARGAGVDKFKFGLIVAGRGKLFVRGKLVIDNWTKQRQGQAFFGAGTEEETGVASVGQGEMLEVLVEFSNVGPRGGAGDEGVNGLPAQPGLRLGGRDVVDADKAMRDAVACAAAADVAIVVVGLNGEWESEGYDRTTLALPGRTDELVEKVIKANPKTVVVTQSVRVLFFVLSVGLMLMGVYCCVGIGNYDAMGGQCTCVGARMVSRQRNG